MNTITSTPDRLDKIRTGVEACFPAEKAKNVGYYVPEAFILFLQELSAKDRSNPPPVKEAEKQYGKYKVKNSVRKLTPDEIKEREAAAMAMIVQTMKKQRKTL